MYSIAFPNFLSNTRTRLVEDLDATKQNLKLLLLSRKRELFGDPDFGTDLYFAFFNQNSPVLADLVIDGIYTAIITKMPQIIITRKDITVSQNGTGISVEIRATNRTDHTVNLYQIDLTDSELREV